METPTPDNPTPVTSADSSAPATPPTLSFPGGMRSTFLTVICILTFIGSGWGIIKSVRDYVTADTIANITSGVMENAESQMDQQNAPNFVKQIMGSVGNLSAGNIKTYSIFGLISNLLTLAGAILMWNLKKPGFYLYLAGIILIVAAPLIIGNLIGIIGGVFEGFVGVIFIVMYAVNLKDMRRQG